mgnify:CR=1 FL=1
MKLKIKNLKTYTLDPRDYGMEYANSAELVGGDKMKMLKLQGIF